MNFSQYHFVGVAGVGMSAVAQAVRFAGARVTGSDRYNDRGSAIPILGQLEKSGVGLYAQDGSGVMDGAEAVVVSTAIELDNPDIVIAEERGIPVLHRSEVLAELVDGKTCVAVAGTSGKSTVTGMVGWILEQAGFDPFVINGAPVINWQSEDCIGNARCGSGKLWVIEADESDRSLLNYSPEYAVITNMSADHFGLEDTVELFEEFKSNVRGQIVGALDGSGYLDGVDSDVTASSSRFVYEGIEFELPLPGQHNVEDALHATVLCELVGVSIEQSASALRSFRGIHRRLEVIGKVGGVTVIDDYGHNPAKIAAAWNAVVPFARRGIVIWRPHGYGPLCSLLDEFSWQIKRGASECMFSAIHELITSNGITTADISLFGIGLGPGNFTGLRTSLSAIQALALPSNTDIIGISSAEAATFQFMVSDLRVQSSERNSPSKPPSTRILAVGDARRRRLWLATFETKKESLQQIGKFELVPMDNFAEKIKLGDTIITPDIETLETELSVIVPNTATLIKVKQTPTASNIASLANQHKATNTPGNPLKPIYMHPPVFIEPRFTEATKRKF